MWMGTPTAKIFVDGLWGSIAKMYHCQICARVIKLRRGRIAKHGYKVLDQQFIGNCPGSDHLPYEESCQLIKDWLIPVLQSEINLLKGKIQERQENTSLVTVNLSDEPIQIIRSIDGQRLGVEYLEPTKIRQAFNICLPDAHLGIEAIAKAYDLKAVARYSNRIEQLNKRIKNEEKRIQNWIALHE